MSHQLNELKTTSQERFTEIENLKTRITVIQEDNKNIRLKSDESLSKVKEKEVLYKELLDKLTELQQKLHSDQIKVFFRDFSLLCEFAWNSFQSDKTFKYYRINRTYRIFDIKHA